MHLQNPDFAAKAAALLTRAPFVQALGIRMLSLEPGLCTTELAVRADHAQQDGFVHAGVVATLADHTAGAAAVTLVRAEESILSIEYKINLLRPAVGATLSCRGTVLRQGRTIIVAEAEVRCEVDGADKLVAKATVTLAVVRMSEASPAAVG